LADHLALKDLSGTLDDVSDTAYARRCSARPGPAYFGELKLRYYLVKLLRAVAFFEKSKIDRGAIELTVSRHRDEDYAELFASLAAAHHWSFTVAWRTAAPQAAVCPPRNAWWRRAAAAVSSGTNPSWPRQVSSRVVLCGS